MTCNSQLGIGMLPPESWPPYRPFPMSGGTLGSLTVTAPRDICSDLRKPEQTGRPSALGATASSGGSSLTPLMSGRGHCPQARVRQDRGGIIIYSNRQFQPLISGTHHKLQFFPWLQKLQKFVKNLENRKYKGRVHNPRNMKIFTVNVLAIFIFPCVCVCVYLR